MNIYHVTAEHTGGHSVDHPCTRGIYGDPADDFDEIIEADSTAEAEQIGWRRLEAVCLATEPCWCKRKCAPGSHGWYNSVVLTVDLDQTTP